MSRRRPLFYRSRIANCQRDEETPMNVPRQIALGDKQNKYVVRVTNRALNDLIKTNNAVP